jgi:hypothetical protein
MGWYGSTPLKNSNLLALAKQITPMRRRHFVQRLAGPTAIELAPAGLCVALSAIDAMRATCNVQSGLRRLHV